MTTTYADCAAAFEGDTAASWAAAALADIAAGASPVRAARHPLGFSCLPLLREDRLGICVHLWDGTGATALTTSEVHCHSWALRSCVLFGRIGNQRVRVEDAGARHRLFRVVSEEDGDLLEATDRTVSCAPGEVEWHTAAQTYDLPIGVFHRSVSDPAVETATLVLGVDDPTAPNLSVGGLDVGTHRTRRRRLDAADTARVARRVLAGLGTAGNR
jgi:hypothetical protein